MRIRSFWAEGFRSLRQVKIENLGPFNVFYGPNGAGKSNILLAMDKLVRAVARRLGGTDDSGDFAYSRDDLRKPDCRGWVRELITENDFCYSAPTPKIRLGMIVEDPKKPLILFDFLQITSLTVEITIERLSAGMIGLHVSKLSGEDGDLRHFWLGPSDQSSQDARVQDVKLQFVRWFYDVFGRSSYCLIPAVRMIRSEYSDLRERNKPGFATLLDNGRVQEAFVLALTSPDKIIRARFARLRELLSGAPLNRPAFDPVYDPETGINEIRERSRIPGAPDVPLDQSGLGVQQIYAVLAQVLLNRSFAIGIEEPEAHLHAPTSGIHLRNLLKRIVDEEDIRQLFVSTHSNLFDLDPSGYFDVRLEDGDTLVERRTNLSDIDYRHLYEPGPAKHGLEDLLRLVPPETPVMRRSEGTTVSARDMLDLLQQDAPEAVDFLRDVHGAAIRAVQLRAKKKV